MAREHCAACRLEGPSGYQYTNILVYNEQGRIVLATTTVQLACRDEHSSLTLATGAENRMRVYRIVSHYILPYPIAHPTQVASRKSETPSHPIPSHLSLHIHPSPSTLTHPSTQPLPPVPSTPRSQPSTSPPQPPAPRSSQPYSAADSARSWCCGCVRRSACRSWRRSGMS